MLAFGVPVPGTIRAVAARLMAATIAATAVRAAVLSSPRTANSRTRMPLRIC
ncbi:hypothetical protein MHAS44199_20920 [Mycolicibacterium hassiacum DSM 44199]|nr:hypothetical protein [Mycolicibacterium hassiacum DSM 44199]